ncbi:bifunctional N(6)-L-threonylcarbamoyladenine synthase/serine/threonine protein kinase [Candidatus Bathyarchaeota archaeon]|nr:MAG: bifunctional N(6)-L-threonylcarbamoyladenine synthase/serine/threonine protein kinase [Candidatus Bathyarchaeota archaeon]
MICLGIESTADDFSVGVVRSDGTIMSNVVDAFSSPDGGIHPREAARHHSEVAGLVLRRALDVAGVGMDEVDVIAFSQGPGMGPCLRTGATVARALASYFRKPLVGVNHCVAHVEIGRLVCELEDPLTLYVSGGNTLVTAYEGGRYRVFGETLDIPVGNCLDVFAREAGLRPGPGRPLGALVEELARGGRELVPLPYVVKGMDLSFSGLLTAALRLLRSGRYRLEDLCFSLQEVAFSMLAEVTERALAHTEKEELLLTGGVAANGRLRSMLAQVAEEHGARFAVVPKELALDNGAMIAWTGLLAYRHGLITPVEESYVRPRWRIDEAPVPWRSSG